MELEYIIKNEIKLQPPFNKSCLYIIQPNDLPERLKNCRRCGVAGTRSLQIAMEEGADPDLPFGSKSSNLARQEDPKLLPC